MNEVASPDVRRRTAWQAVTALNYRYSMKTVIQTNIGPGSGNGTRALFLRNRKLFLDNTLRLFEKMCRIGLGLSVLEREHTGVCLDLVSCGSKQRN